MDSELDEILKTIPNHPFGYTEGEPSKPNAYVYYNPTRGLLEILFLEGGWIGAPHMTLLADIAPFAG
jgi:hypothetical protein